MMDLCSLTTVRSLLDKYGLAPRKGFGQNFLINASVPERIAACSRVYAPKDRPAGVLEIGPGVGENVGKPLVWQFHTRAKIEVSEDGKSAVLTQSNGTKDCTLGVHLTQATNSAARFEVRETTQGPDENPNTGVLRLVISVPVTAEKQVLEVKFTSPK